MFRALIWKAMSCNRLDETYGSSSSSRNSSLKTEIEDQTVLSILDNVAIALMKRKTKEYTEKRLEKG
jgi:hypothetical protein